MARTPVALSAQIDEVNREVSHRQVTHPGKVRSGQLSRTISEAQIERMEYALKTLRFVKEHQDKIRAACGPLPWEVTA